MKGSAVDSVTSQIEALRIADESTVGNLRKTCKLIGFQAGQQGLPGAVEAFRNGVNCLLTGRHNRSIFIFCHVESCGVFFAMTANLTCKALTEASWRIFFFTGYDVLCESFL